MAEMIPGLRGTVTHRLSVAVYQRHHDAGRGACGRCGHPAQCAARRHAAAVILAAGAAPHWYDSPAGPDGVLPETPMGAAGPEDSSGAAVTADYGGFSVGDRAGRQHPAGFSYECDDP